MRTLELFSIDQILWAKVPTAVQAAGGSDPIQTPTETEKTLSITTLNFGSSALMPCEKGH